MVSALSDNPGNMIHQDRETPLRVSDQAYDAFFGESGGLVVRESKAVTIELFKDARIYGKFIFI